MNALEKFVADRGLTEVTGKIFDLEKKDDNKSVVGLYTRVLCNTTTGQSIFIKYFAKHKNIMISVNPTPGKND
jgi:hypothetical protein